MGSRQIDYAFRRKCAWLFWELAVAPLALGILFAARVLWADAADTSTPEDEHAAWVRFWVITAVFVFPAMTGILTLGIVVASTLYAKGAGDSIWLLAPALSALQVAILPGMLLAFGPNAFMFVPLWHATMIWSAVTLLLARKQGRGEAPRGPVNGVDRVQPA